MPDSVRRSVPNGLTVLRLLLAALFFASLNVYRYPDADRLWAFVAVGIFILAAVTDALDGYLARKWEAVSVFGRIMDPFCDKVLVLGAFIYLAGPRFVVAEWVQADAFFTMATGIYPWMVVVMLARELLVTGFRGEAEAMGADFASTWSGKWKMIIQSVAVPVVITLVVVFRTGDETTLSKAARWLCYGVVYLTVGVTIVSALPYVGRLRQVMAGHTGGRAPS